MMHAMYTGDLRLCQSGVCAAGREEARPWVDRSQHCRDASIRRVLQPERHHDMLARYVHEVKMILQPDFHPELYYTGTQ